MVGCRRPYRSMLQGRGVANVVGWWEGERRTMGRYVWHGASSCFPTWIPPWQCDLKSAQPYLMRCQIPLPLGQEKAAGLLPARHDNCLHEIVYRKQATQRRHCQPCFKFLHSRSIVPSSSPTRPDTTRKAPRTKQQPLHTLDPRLDPRNLIILLLVPRVSRAVASSASKPVTRCHIRHAI